MNLPNLLSIFRLILTIFFILSIHYQKYNTALIIFVVQAISDLLDGFFARIMKEKTYLGSILDPLADKVMLVSSYIVLSANNVIPIWVTLTVLSRDIILSTGFLILYKLSYKTRHAPSIISKITTLCQMSTVVYILWSGTRVYGDYFFYATVILTVVSGCLYIVRGLRILMNK
jgi:cardiolipin synthase (CMP-forming)